MNVDNKRLCYIEGGKFESIQYGDERNAVVATIKMPPDFTLSARALIFLEVEEYDRLNEERKKLALDIVKKEMAIREILLYAENALRYCDFKYDCNDKYNESEGFAEAIKKCKEVTKDSL